MVAFPGEQGMRGELDGLGIILYFSGGIRGIARGFYES
jgi:hypothetical protein